MKLASRFLLGFLFTTTAFAQMPQDEHFNKQWYLMYQKDNLGVNAVEAWSMTKGNAKVIVAVIDTGVDYNHPDIKDNIWKNTREVPGNGVDDEGNGFIDDTHGYNFANSNNDPMDLHGHGTHVAGIIGASHNSIGIAGVMAKVSIMPLRVSATRGAKGWSEVAKAIIYAVDNGASVINMSLGEENFYQDVYDAIAYAAKHQVVVVVAAGNSGNTVKNYPASYELPNIVAVASVTAANIRSSFSSYGIKNVHVFAPGSQIYSLRPNAGYTFMDGTSMASPVVAGVAGLVIAYHGKRAAPQMRERLMHTSRKLKRLDGMVSSNGVVSAPHAITGQLSLEILID